jgi:hypothetical protein
VPASGQVRYEAHTITNANCVHNNPASRIIHRLPIASPRLAPTFPPLTLEIQPSIISQPPHHTCTLCYRSAHLQNLFHSTLQASSLRPSLSSISLYIRRLDRESITTLSIPFPQPCLLCPAIERLSFASLSSRRKTSDSLMTRLADLEEQ